MQRIILFTDGGCHGNDQPDPSKRTMVAVVTDQVGGVLFEKRIPGGSNNLAELIAVREALVLARTKGHAAVEIRTDSKNNLAWVSGKIGDGLNNREIVLALRKSIDALRQDIDLQLVWVPRAANIAGKYLESRTAPGGRKL